MSVDVLDRELEQKQGHEPGGPRIRCPLCGCRHAKTTAGFAPAAMTGTPSIREASARFVSISGRKPNAFRAVAGHSTRIGITIHDIRNRRTHRAQFPPTFAMIGGLE